MKKIYFDKPYFFITLMISWISRGKDLRSVMCSYIVLYIMLVCIDINIMSCWLYYFVISCRLIPAHKFVRLEWIYYKIKHLRKINKWSYAVCLCHQLCMRLQYIWYRCIYMYIIPYVPRITECMNTHGICLHMWDSLMYTCILFIL